jgi:phenylalanyl-tRNA synthetase alpha chain
MQLSLETIAEFEAHAVQRLKGVSDAEGLEAWRIEVLGSSGTLKTMLGGLKDVPKDVKPAIGARLNAAKSAIEQAFEGRRSEVSGVGKGVGAGGPLVDMTEPSISLGLGRAHVIARVRDDLCEVFGRMGFSVADGPELEDDDHNFVKLNIPPEHPARDPIDNFYVDDPGIGKAARMLRSQTSTVQVRVMEEAVKRGGGTLREAIRVVAPGRVYRPDTVDATHSFMFHQIEGLYVDRGVTLADLKTTLLVFARAYFGPEAQVRLRPSYFPFTEPSAELDMLIQLRPDQPARWIELGGCGMVDPAVFAACGVDNEEWTGFAFGFGIERLAMGKYAIPDIRLLYENDVRFLAEI